MQSDERNTTMLTLSDERVYWSHLFPLVGESPALNMYIHTLSHTYTWTSPAFDQGLRSPEVILILVRLRDPRHTQLVACFYK